MDETHTARRTTDRVAAGYAPVRAAGTTRAPPAAIRWMGILLLLCAGCRSFRPASDTHPPPGPQGRVVHSDPEIGYAIIDFDLWPQPGDQLHLVDGHGVTAAVEVTARRRGGYFVVNVLDGRPKKGDHVSAGASKERNDASD